MADSFFSRPTLDVARALIGAVLVHQSPRGRLSGRIVETEGYIAPGDEACHAYRGETPRNRVMFGPPGHAYVYISYGMHRMLNVVTEAPGIGAAVLIRAIEPLDGVEVMAELRGLDAPYDLSGRPSRLLASGPGRLCQAMGIDLGLNGVSLSCSPLYIEAYEGRPLPIVQTTRIGITRSVELPWRFYLLGSRDVSVRHRATEAAQFPAPYRAHPDSGAAG